MGQSGFQTGQALRLKALRMSLTRPDMSKGFSQSPLPANPFPPYPKGFFATAIKTIGAPPPLSQIL
jgi:hypothetical protein